MDFSKLWKNNSDQEEECTCNEDDVSQKISLEIKQGVPI